MEGAPETTPPEPPSPAERRARIGKAVRKRLLVLTALILPWTIPIFFAPFWWVFENIGEFSLQILIAELVLLILWALTLAFRWIHWKRAIVPIALTVVAMTNPLFDLWPLWFGEAAVVETGAKSFNVMAVNVHSSNRSFEHVLALVEAEKPHVVILLEIDSKWREALSVLEGEYPSNYFQPSDHDNFGIAALSRIAGATLTARNLRPEIPHVADTVHVVLPWEGRKVEVIGVHAVPPVSRGYAGGNATQLAALCGYVGEAKHPCILAGDFNRTPWSRTFCCLLIDGRLEHGRLGRGYMSTWPAGVPFMRLPIDHVLVTEDLAITRFRRFPPGGSDHNPILAEVIFTAGTQRSQR
jgi:endonuclease/exonuclease/phosphatase (EEP) superfamily protein YafD